MTIGINGYSDCSAGLNFDERYQNKGKSSYLWANSFRAEYGWRKGKEAVAFFLSVVMNEKSSHKRAGEKEDALKEKKLSRLNISI